jgi:hypothetical protein
MAQVVVQQQLRVAVKAFASVIGEGAAEQRGSESDNDGDSEDGDMAAPADFVVDGDDGDSDSDDGSDRWKRGPGYARRSAGICRSKVRALSAFWLAAHDLEVVPCS